MFMRASAAAAALFFVVAVVNDPGNETPVADLAFESVQMSAAETTATGPALEPLRATEDGAGGGTAGGAGGAAGLAAPAPGAPTPDGDAPASDGPTDGGDAQNGTPGVQTVDPAGASASGAAESLADNVAADPPAEAREEMQPLPAGTELLKDSSQGAGGMAFGLGTLAALLTALSALTAWTRRSDGRTR
jgi:hypothetical protein